MAALYTAADLTGMETNTVGLLTGFITIGLVFVAYRLIKKAGIR